MKHSLLPKLSKVLKLAAVLALPAMAFPISAQDSNYYSVDFSNTDLTGQGFTILDSNQDKTTWVHNGSKVTFRKLDGESISAVEKYLVAIDNKENDDWLITPSLRFESGKTYRLNITMAKMMFAAIPETFEIKLGSDKTAAAMTTQVLPMTGLPEMGGNSLWSFQAEISVPATADYYLGIHASGKPGMKLAVADLAIKNGVAVVAPAAIADFKAIPDPNGDKKVKFTFTTPSQAKDGSPLESVSRIEIRSNDELFETIYNPAPGSAQEIEKYVAVNGIYTFSATAFSESGAGDPVSATVFVGVNSPSSAVNVNAENAGMLQTKVTWEAPETDKDGYPISSAVVKYDVLRSELYSSEADTVATDIDGLTFTDTLEAITDEEGNPTQKFFTYSVAAKTSEGSAAKVTSHAVPMGAPYSVPFKESFAGGRYSTLCTSWNNDAFTYWSTTCNLEDLDCFDLDNGMLFLHGAIGGSSTLQTALIDLSAIDAPTLSFYTYNIKGSEPADHTVEVKVTTADGETTSFGAFVPEFGWKKKIIRLDDFQGKVVKLQFIGARNNGTTLALDNINISNIYRNDLTIRNITLPAEVKSSEPYEVAVDVLNFGSETTGDYTVSLFCDGELVAEQQATALAEGAVNTVKFTHVQGIMAPEEITYYATITYAADEDNSNNTSDSFTTRVLKNSYPVVNDLTGSYIDGTVVLSWSEPDTSNAQPYPVTEDFESYDSWATEGVGGWTFVDKDQATIAGFAEGNMPGIPDYSQQSWWIFDNTHEDFNNGSFNTSSGHKFLASMVSGIQGEGYVQNDDWAISPELYGGVQKISINARSYSLSESERESFEVLYSTGSLEPDDFTSLGTYTDIPSEYQAYEVNLPAGAKHFAIRNISLGKYVLMVDDVTYIPVGDPAAFSINGYNVYCDGRKINEEPVEENEYTHAEAGDPNHTYNVSVLYSAGESLLSNDYNPSETGLGITETSAFQAVGADGEILLAGATAPVYVYSPDGRLVASANACDRAARVSAGCYLVVCGNSTVKVVVK